MEPFTRSGACAEGVQQTELAIGSQVSVRLLIAPDVALIPRGARMPGKDDMVSRLRLARFRLAFVLATSACQNTGEPSTSGSAEQGGLTQTEFVAAFRDLSCQNLKRCCTAAGYGYDSAVCSTLFANAGQGTSTTVYNPNSGQQCITDMATSTECYLAGVAPLCTQVYAGTRLPGELCTSNLDCAQPLDGDATCDLLRGFCVAGLPGQLNHVCQQSCERNNNGNVTCVWGSASTESANGTVVVNCFANDGLACGSGGTCVALAETGQPCANDASCNRALYCAISASGVDSTCQPRRALGSACVDYSAPCINAAYCSAGTCAAKKANGERCFANAECLGVCNCGASGDCMTIGVCVDPNALLTSFATALVSASYCAAAP